MLNLRGLTAVGLGIVLSLSACTSDEFGAACDDVWHERCAAAGCKASDAAWAGCKINGWTFRPDAMCAPSTEYPGDDQALCPLTEEEGYSFHYGPANYDDPDLVAPFLIDGMMEEENCFQQEVGNAERFYFNRYSGRMRPQSHHMIIRALQGSGTPDLGLLPSCNGASRDLSASFITGSQTPSIDYPDLWLPHDADDDVTAQYLDANMVVSLDLHYVNRTPNTILREGWVNLHRTDPATVQIAQNGISLIGLSVTVPPMSTGTVNRHSVPVPSDRKIVALTGHFHKNGTRFSVFIKRAGSTTEELVYEMYDPIDPYAAGYRVAQENPTPDRALGIPGGFSGDLHVKAGDTLTWECEMDNPTMVTVKFGDKSTDQMCNLFGYYTATDGDHGAWNSFGI
jgi:hypothetical protein